MKNPESKENRDISFSKEIQNTCPVLFIDK